MNNSFFNMRRIGMGPIAKRSGSSLLVVAAILAAPVQAQDVGADETGGTADEIIVTGTLIANPILKNRRRSRSSLPTKSIFGRLL